MVRSAFEPRVVAVQEAASANGLILARERLGAVVNVAGPNYNGFIFGCKSFEGLVSLMSQKSAMRDACTDVMSCAGHLLSRQTSADRLACTLLQYLPARRRHRRQVGWGSQTGMKSVPDDPEARIISAV
jgi:hypothetical protein